MVHNDEVAGLRDELARLEQENAELRADRGEIPISMTGLLALDGSETAFGLFTINLSTGRLYLSSVARDMYGIGPDRPLDMELVFSAVHPDDRERVRTVIGQVMDTRRVEGLDYRIRTPDGQVRYITSSAAFVERDGQSFLLGPMIDRTAEERLREQLQVAALELSNSARLTQIASFRWSPGRELEWSEPMWALLELDRNVEPSAERFNEMIHPDDRSIVEAMNERTMRGLENPVTRFRLCVASGVKHVLGTAKFVSEDRSTLIGALLDVTETVELGEQLEQAQRLVPVGQMAAGLAHDFNNTLTAILANVQLLRDYPELVSLDEIEEAVDAAAQISRQLMQYARPSATGYGGLLLAHELRRISRLVRSLLPENIEVVYDLDADAPSVTMNAGHLQQIVLNLVANARHAMPDGGRIEIRARGQEYQGLEGAALIVRDTGVGMSPQTQASCLSPFFTTREELGGTGLGLSMCQTMVERVGGYLEVASVEGEGTSIEIWLPTHRIDDTSVSTNPTSEHLSLVLVAPEHTGRDALARVLALRGHQVTSCAEPRQALHIDMVSLDVAVADTDTLDRKAIDLVHELRELRSDLPVVLMSSEPTSVVVPSDVSVVQKPIDADALIAVLQRTMATES